MTVNLFTQDDAVEEFCRQMAKESAGPSSLAVRTAGFAPDERPEGLCIYDWDVVPRQEDVTALDRPDNIILTARHVPAPLLSFTQALVLLKPLNRARLELALRSAEPAGSTADQAAQLSRLDIVSRRSLAS